MGVPTLTWKARGPRSHAALTLCPRNNQGLSLLTFSRSLQPDPRTLPLSLLAATLVGKRPEHPTNEVSPGAFHHDCEACGQSGHVSNFAQILHSNLRKQDGSKHQSQALSVSIQL